MDCYIGKVSNKSGLGAAANPRPVRSFIEIYVPVKRANRSPSTEEVVKDVYEFAKQHGQVSEAVANKVLNSNSTGVSRSNSVKVKRGRASTSSGRPGTAADGALSDGRPRTAKVIERQISWTLTETPTAPTTATSPNSWLHDGVPAIKEDGPLFAGTGKESDTESADVAASGLTDAAVTVIPGSNQNLDQAGGKKKKSIGSSIKNIFVGKSSKADLAASKQNVGSESTQSAAISVTSAEPVAKLKLSQRLFGKSSKASLAGSAQNDASKVASQPEITVSAPQNIPMPYVASAAGPAITNVGETKNAKSHDESGKSNHQPLAAKPPSSPKAEARVIKGKKSVSPPVATAQTGKGATATHGHESDSVATKGIAEQKVKSAPKSNGPKSKQTLVTTNILVAAASHEKLVPHSAENKMTPAPTTDATSIVEVTATSTPTSPGISEVAVTPVSSPVAESSPKNISLSQKLFGRSKQDLAKSKDIVATELPATAIKEPIGGEGAAGLEVALGPALADLKKTGSKSKLSSSFAKIFGGKSSKANLLASQEIKKSTETAQPATAPKSEAMGVSAPIESAFKPPKSVLLDDSAPIESAFKPPKYALLEVDVAAKEKSASRASLSTGVAVGSQPLKSVLKNSNTKLSSAAVTEVDVQATIPAQNKELGNSTEKLKDRFQNGSVASLNSKKVRFDSFKWDSANNQNALEHQPKSVKSNSGLADINTTTPNIIATNVIGNADDTSATPQVQAL